MPEHRQSIQRRWSIGGTASVATSELSNCVVLGSSRQQCAPPEARAEARGLRQSFRKARNALPRWLHSRGPLAIGRPLRSCCASFPQPKKAEPPPQIAFLCSPHHHRTANYSSTSATAPPLRQDPRSQISPRTRPPDRKKFLYSRHQQPLARTLIPPQRTFPILPRAQ